MSANREEQLFADHLGRPSRDSLIALLRHHQDRVYTACYQVLNHPEDAEDAAQEVLIEAVRCLPRMTSARAFKAWLYRVSLTTSLDTRRARARRAEVARLASTAQGAPAMDRADRDALMQAIADLDDETRCLLLEHYFDKTTLEELGRREGISAVAIWKRLERAKERLRTTLATAGFGVAAAAVGPTLEAVTPTAAPALLVTETVAGHAAVVAAGGAVVGTKAVLSGGVVLSFIIAASVAGPTGYFIGTRQVRKEHSSTVLTAPTVVAASGSSMPTRDGTSMAAPSAASIEDRTLLKQRAVELLQSLNGTRLRNASVADQLLAFEPDLVMEVLNELWPSLQAFDRRELLRAFEEGSFARIVDLLDLAMRDPQESIGKAESLRNAANRYLQSYAFRDFASEGGYEPWRKSIVGKSLEEVRAESAKSFVTRFDQASMEEALVMLRMIGRVPGTGAMEALVRAGVLSAFERHLSRIPSDQGYDYLGILSRFSLDEAYLRRVVVPWMDRNTVDGNASASAMLMLGKPGNTWAIDILMPYMQSGDRTHVWWAADALARIKDSRVIPAMIDAINRDNTYTTVYGIGYFGLGKLTGVQYDKTHDGAWWTDWWQKNQARFAAPK